MLARDIVIQENVGKGGAVKRRRTFAKLNPDRLVNLSSMRKFESGAG
jgi:hypothetical protein